jgi:hypothetical protein
MFFSPIDDFVGDAAEIDAAAATVAATKRIAAPSFFMSFLRL